MDKSGAIVRNKDGLVAKVYNQKEWIDFDETFTLTPSLESIGMLLAFSCCKDFVLYQMYIKSIFLNDYITEQIYIKQSPRFEN